MAGLNLNTADLTESSRKIVFGGPGSPVVSVDCNDGSVTFGEGVTPDEAAQTFWDAVTRTVPNRG